MKREVIPLTTQRPRVVGTVTSFTEGDAPEAQGKRTLAVQGHAAQEDAVRFEP